MMALLAKALLLALLCASSSADCSVSGDCHNDETSLVQVKSIVKHGGDRAVDEATGALDEESTEDSTTETEEQATDQKVGDNVPVYVDGALVANTAEQTQVAEMAGQAAVEAQPWQPNTWPTPVTNWKAVADSTPAGIDNGQVSAAFATNKEKVRSTIENRAVENLAFDSKVRTERQAIRTATAEKLQKTRVATAAAIHQDRVEVAKTAANRAAVVKESVRKVNLAKESAIAHGRKMRQTQQAAILGRLVGAQEGREEAARANYEQKHAWEVERAANVIKAEKEAIAKKKAFDRAAIDKATEIRAAELGVLAAKDRKESEAIEASSAANAALAEEGIEGPEGVKNKMTDHEADRVVQEYGRLSGRNQKVIDDLSTAHEALASADDGLAAAETKLAAAEDSLP